MGEKIQTNKMREHFEEETFELKNKVKVVKRKWVNLRVLFDQYDNKMHSQYGAHS